MVVSVDANQRTIAMEQSNAPRPSHSVPWYNADAEAVMVPNKTHVCTYAGKWFSRSHSSDQSDRGAAYTKTPLA